MGGSTVADGAPFPGDVARWSERWGLPVRRILRGDAAFLLAGDCDAWTSSTSDAEFYDLEPLPGGAGCPAGEMALTSPMENVFGETRMGCGFLAERSADRR